MNAADILAMSSKLFLDSLLRPGLIALDHRYFQTPWTSNDILRQSEFHLQVVYKKGSWNTQEDALSRLSTLGEMTVPTDEEIRYFTMEGGGKEP